MTKIPVSSTGVVFSETPRPHGWQLHPHEALRLSALDGQRQITDEKPSIPRAHLHCLRLSHRASSTKLRLALWSSQRAMKTLILVCRWIALASPLAAPPTHDAILLTSTFRSPRQLETQPTGLPQPVGRVHSHIKPTSPVGHSIRRPTSLLLAQRHRRPPSSGRDGHRSILKYHLFNMHLW